MEFLIRYKYSTWKNTFRTVNIKHTVNDSDIKIYNLTLLLIRVFTTVIYFVLDTAIAK